MMNIFKVRPRVEMPLSGRASAYVGRNLAVIPALKLVPKKYVIVKQ